MGRQNKLKQIANNSQLFLSANAPAFLGISGDQTAQVLEETLDVSLVHLHRDVLSKVKIGDSVSVDIQRSPFRVVASKGSLGDIPKRYEEAVLNNRAFSGSIIELRLVPPGLRVRLKRKT
jgi:hypothetical protein